MSPPELRHAQVRWPSAVPLPLPGAGASAPQPSEAQRLRILAAMVRVVREQGAESATVARVIDLAGVSRRTFYQCFADRSDCLLAAIEDAVALASARARAACAGERRWVDRVRSGLLELLAFCDEEPELAWLCVVQAPASGPAALARRGEVLCELARVVDGGRGLAPAARNPPPLAAEGVVGGALGVIHERLLQPRSAARVNLLNPLMAMIVLPYLGGAAARKELARPAVERSPGERTPRSAPDPLAGLNMRLTYRTLRVLTVIARRPGLSNLEISKRAGITDQGQISKLLARLAGLRLMVNTGKGQAVGGPNAWRLTPRGKALERAIRRETVHMGR